MKNVFVIHGYNGDTSETFGPYLKKECDARKIECFFPIFPIKQEATFESWAEVMDKYWEKGIIHEKTTIIAHSLGTQFWIRYAVLKSIKIQTFISIAGFVEMQAQREELREVVGRFKPSDLEYNKFIKITPNRYSIYSDNDHLNPEQELERYAEKIEAQKVFVKGIGHCGRKSGVKELPEVVRIIDEL